MLLENDPFNDKIAIQDIAILFGRLLNECQEVKAQNTRINQHLENLTHQNQKLIELNKELINKTIVIPKNTNDKSPGNEGRQERSANRKAKWLKV